MPRASTHLDDTDLPLVLPASRYGQDLTSVYHCSAYDVRAAGRHRDLDVAGVGC